MKVETKKLLNATGISLFIVVNLILFLSIGFINPLLSFSEILKLKKLSILIFFFSVNLILYLIFKILEFYYTQLREQNKLLEKLNTSLMKITSNLKIEIFLKNSLETLMDFCQGQMGVFVLLNEKLKKFSSSDVITINQNINPDILPENYRLLTFFPGKISEDISKRINSLIEEYEFNKCRTVIVVPVYDDKETKGIAVIGSASKVDKKFIKIYDYLKIVVGLFIKQLNIMIENSILHEDINEASITDPLTHLYNRRYFGVRTKQEFMKAKREGFPVSIMISDLDNFKHYVDTYGHPKGDIILSEVAKVIRNSLRESDVACRFGGDEFAYLLPFTSSVEAKTVAERVKKNIAEYKFLDGKVDGEVHITLSIGIASFPEHGTEVEEIVSKADHALFEAKDTGKDRIVIYQEKEDKNGTIS